MHTDTVRVIIVEDDSDLRESLATYLTLCGSSVAGVGSCREFYRALDNQIYDIAVIDVGLPDQSGFVLTEYVHNNTAMGIIMLTARDSDEDKLRGYDAGADIYLTKPVDSRMLASAITNLMARLKPLPGTHPPVSTQLSWILVQSGWILQTPQGNKISLTGMEFKFMTFLGQSESAAVSRSDIMQKLYSRTDDYSGKALDALIYRLRSKVSSVCSLPIPIKSIHAVGYCFSAPLQIT